MTYKEAVEEIAYEFEAGFGCKLGDINQRGNWFTVEIKDANGFPPKDFEEAAYDGLEYLLEDKAHGVFVSVIWDVLSGNPVEVRFEFD
jgi:hypothetical protein